jgi:hypothetical protein
MIGSAAGMQSAAATQGRDMLTKAFFALPLAALLIAAEPAPVVAPEPSIAPPPEVVANPADHLFLDLPTGARSRSCFGPTSPRTTSSGYKRLYAEDFTMASSSTG